MPVSYSSGMHQVTPHITVSDAAKAIDFYKRAFGAQEEGRSVTPAGKIMHARLAIGDSHIMLNDAFPEMGGAPAPAADAASPYAIHLYVTDADAVFNSAVAAGAAVKMPPMDMFWGDRYSQLVDPFGYRWAIATHKEDVPTDELERRAAAMFANFGKGQGK